ncbi:MAG TPA: amidohydrolase family protein, partial [Pseudonocardiaceae bacterium]|nr:amidohydrolase family protein [Pseudonocardiaceae bacterium]
RVGLRLTGTRPTDAEVRKAADHWRQSSTTRLANETLHRYLIWLAIDNGLPVQFHVGYGDADLNLHECDPLLLTDLLRATQHTGVPIMLLHNYPFHRSSGYLAQVFPHVFVDVGLATHHAGFRGPGLIAELLEITPFGKVLYSSDAFGLAEHYMLGALLFRRGLSDFLKAGITQDALTPQDAERVAGLVSRHNAQRVYQRTSE